MTDYPRPTAAKMELLVAPAAPAGPGPLPKPAALTSPASLRKPASLIGLPSSVGATTFPRVVRSEWLKLRSLRSTAWCWATMLVIMVGFAAVAGSVLLPDGAQLLPADRRGDQLTSVLAGTGGATLVAAVLGVLAIGREYGSGAFRQSMTVVPRRLPVVLAKLGVVGVSTLAVALVGAGLSLAACSAVLAAYGVPNHLLEPELLLPTLVGAPVGLTLLTLLALAAATIVRSTALALPLVLAGLTVVPLGLAGASLWYSKPWLDNLVSVMPTSAARALRAYPAATGGVEAGLLTLGPGQGLLVLLAWLVLLAGAALVLVRRRDA